MESEPTMKRVSRAMLWCLSAVCLGLAGCSSSGKLEVAFVSNNAADFWKIAEAGCRKAEADLGIKVNVRMPPNGTAAEQKEYIDTLLSQGVKGIAISVIDPKNQSDFLAKVAKRTNLITQDNDAPASGRLCYIGTDNYQAGLATGELVKEALPDGGVIGIFVGQIEPLNAQQRRNGVLDALAGERVAEARGGAPGQYGKYRLVNVYVDGVNEKIAKEKAQDFLSETQKEPKVCMVGLWAYNPPAMLSAYEKYTGENKPGIRLVGFDEHADTLRGSPKEPSSAPSSKTRSSSGTNRPVCWRPWPGATAQSCPPMVCCMCPIASSPRLAAQVGSRWTSSRLNWPACWAKHRKPPRPPIGD
jgi:ribose transport system substrate-binding protein